jgi:hypothetical protein
VGDAALINMIPKGTRMTKMKLKKPRYKHGHPGRPKLLSPEQVAELKHLRSEFLRIQRHSTVAALADRFGVGVKTVSKYLDDGHAPPLQRRLV